METNEIRVEAQDINQQGVILLHAGNYEAARAKFDKAIDLDPMCMESYKNYGDLYMALEEYQNAKNSYKKAMLIEKSGLLYFLYGNACFMNDEVHEGFENYNLAISDGYDSADMMFFMGMAYEHMNDDNIALRYFQKACAKNPSRADFIVKKIGALIRLGMIDGADETIDELLLKAPEMYDGYHLKTQILLHKDKDDEAISFAKMASEKFPEDVDLFFDYAKVLSFSKRFDEALCAIERAKKMVYFEDAKRQFVLLEGQIHAENMNIEKAIECCQICISLETDDFFDSEARFMYMNLLLGKLDFEQALKQASEIVLKNTEDLYYYAALYYRPFCKKKLGDVEGANKLYKEANSIYRIATLQNPAAIDIYIYRALCLKDMEQYDKSLEMIDFILNVTTDIAEAYTIRAEIYRIQGRNSLAETEMEKAYRLKPELRELSESAGE